MTLWDMMFAWLGRHRPRRWTRMTPWPRRLMSKPPRYNIIQRWAMRRGLLLLLAMGLLKVNPFNKISLLVIIITGTCVWVEHGVHRRQEVALYGKPNKS